MKHIRRIFPLLLCMSLLSCSSNTPLFSSDVPREEQISAPAPARSSKETAASPSMGISEADVPSETLTVNFVGDVMLAAENGYDGFWSFNLFAYDTPPAYYFEKMQGLFANDDYTVANGENVFTDREDPTPHGGAEGTAGYWCYSGTENAKIYAEGSIEIVSLANNHADDYGEEGRDDTVAALEAVGVTPILDGQSYIMEKGGVRVAMLCVSMYSEYYVTPILEWLAEVNEVSDYQIVYYHGGTERTHEPDAWRIRASHKMADAGADLVLGNHPHVLQPMETYNGCEIVYSLGNFLFGGSHTCENRTMVYTLSLRIHLGEITAETHTATPCYCYGELWQPTVIEDEEDKNRVYEFLRGEREEPF